MAIPKLLPENIPAPFDVQATTFSHDVIGRYVCNTWEEITAAQASGGFPFDAVVIGAGMFGGYCAEKLYRHGPDANLRILVVEAGGFLFPTHIQNPPQRLGGSISGSPTPRDREGRSRGL